MGRPRAFGCVFYGSASKEIQLSDGEMAVEAKLRKGLGGGNVKLSHWTGAFIGVHYVAFIIFWLFTGSIMSTIGTSSPLSFGDEKELIYLAVTNASWLPYLIDQRTEDDPIPVESALVVVDISISEGVTADPVLSVEVVFVAASIFAERKDSATTDTPMEKFPTETDIIADTKISAINAVGGGPSLVVTLSSIPSSATEMPDIVMSPNEASDDVLEDSDDKPIVKTRVFDSEDLSIEEIDAIVAGIDLVSLPLLVFLSCSTPF
ncbi:hypothetical protein SO802_005545 [Lithocarpus litseifolius]|uniref:Uncharacterized protein n=1 Tax=Lithocarpus litseifolius TaxID=425828 RepID=A0AAW2DIV9_9ROSI